MLTNQPCVSEVDGTISASAHIWLYLNWMEHYVNCGHWTGVNILTRSSLTGENRSLDQGSERFENDLKISFIAVAWQRLPRVTHCLAVAIQTRARH